LLEFEKIYPLDAVYDTYDEMPEEVRTNKRYKEVGDCSIGGLAQRLSPISASARSTSSCIPSPTARKSKSRCSR
jgi:hypothetical protein